MAANLTTTSTATSSSATTAVGSYNKCLSVTRIGKEKESEIEMRNEMPADVISSNSSWLPSLSYSLVVALTFSLTQPAAQFSVVPLSGCHFCSLTHLH